MLPKHASPSRSPSRCFSPAPTRSRLTRIIVLSALAFLVALWQLQDVRPSCFFDKKQPVDSKTSLDKPTLSKDAASSSSTPWRVPLEAHIMSKCPDARDCIVDLIVPVMAALPAGMVNFTLSYIGQVTDPDDGVECKHGPSECLGNIVQLCATELYPDPKQNLGFAMCMINQYELIPQRSMIQECAAEYGISFGKLNDCASSDDGSHGVELLRSSVERTRKAGVTLSCTVRLNEKIRCIRDDGEWSDCPGGADPETLVQEITKLYEQQNKR